MGSMEGGLVYRPSQPCCYSFRHQPMRQRVESEPGHRDLPQEDLVWSRIQSLGVHARPKDFDTCAAASRIHVSGAHSGGPSASASRLLDLLLVIADMFAFAFDHAKCVPIRSPQCGGVDPRCLEANQHT